jgi:NAD+ kinase
VADRQAPSIMLGLMGNLGKSGFRTFLPSLVTELKRRSAPFVLDEEAAEGLGLPSHSIMSGSRIPDVATLILSFGGDGTLLRTARMIGERHIPILGVNTGPGLGYLTELSIHDLHDSIDRILAGRFRVEERMMVTANVERDSKTVWHALNEIVVGHAEVSHTLHLELLIDRHPVAAYRSDGIIISTPTGSTAYSLSVGGPVVEPKQKAMIVTPISPHTLTVRPVVIADDRVVEIRTKGPASLAADGETLGPLDDGDVVRVRRSTHTTAIVNLTGNDFYDVLGTKLHWGKGAIVAPPKPSER